MQAHESVLVLQLQLTLIEAVVVPMTGTAPFTCTEPVTVLLIVGEPLTLAPGDVIVSGSITDCE